MDRPAGPSPLPRALQERHGIYDSGDRAAGRRPTRRADLERPARRHRHNRHHEGPAAGPDVVAERDGPESLLDASNLTPVVPALNKRFRNQSVVQLAIYPGELQAVIINNQNEARLVTTDRSGALKIGPALGVNGSRTAIYPNQVTPSVVQQLANLISSSKGGVPLAHISRFALAIRGQNAGWDIYPISGRIRFEALLQGQSPEVITSHGKHALK
jgi:hypothetical protein